MKKIILISIGLMLSVSMAFADSAKSYDVISGNDTSFSGRKRVQIFITAPDAKTANERANTVKIAATDISAQTGAKVVSVFLMPFPEAVGTGYYFARAFYWSDSCGNSGTQCNGKQWEVKSTEQQLTDLQLKIANEFYTNSNKFLDKDGLTDEKKLVNYIAKKLKIKAKDVDFPSLYLEPVE